MGLVTHSPDTISAGIHIAGKMRLVTGKGGERSSRVNILDSMKGPLNLAALVSGENSGSGGSWRHEGKDPGSVYAVW